MVNCGRAGSTFPSVHCDRMRKANEQMLTGENTGMDISTDETEVPSDDENEARSEDKLVVLGPEELQHEVRQPIRQIRKPIWTKDYYLSTCRLTMPMTKVTPRKRCMCPVCKEMILTEDFIRHVTSCQEKRNTCTECDSTFKKMSYIC